MAIEPQESCDVPWKDSSYSHERTLIFFEEIAQCYDLPEAKALRSRFPSFLYQEDRTLYCPHCTQHLLSTTFERSISQGQGGLEYFKELFGLQNVRAIPDWTYRFLMTTLGQAIAHENFPQSMEELDFVGGIYTIFSPTDKRAIQHYVDSERIYLFSLRVLARTPAPPCPLPVSTGIFLEEVLSKTRYDAFWRYHKDCMQQVMLRKLDQIHAALMALQERSIPARPIYVRSLNEDLMTLVHDTTASSSARKSST